MIYKYIMIYYVITITNGDTKDENDSFVNSSSSPPYQIGYLPLTKAALWAGISRRTLKRWIKQGLPFFQAPNGGKILVRPDDINCFLVKRQEPESGIDTLVDDVLRELEMAGKT